MTRSSADERAPKPSGRSPDGESQVVAQVEAAARGDQRAWNALVDRYAGLVWSVARGYRLSEADAADVSQATWLRLVENLDRLRDPAAIAGWLATTTRRECLRVIRRASRETMLDAETWSLVDADEAPVDEALLDLERRREVREAFDRLPERRRQLLLLLVADPPMSYAEISAALQIPIGSIGPTRRRCLEQLRRASGNGRGLGRARHRGRGDVQADVLGAGGAGDVPAPRRATSQHACGHARLVLQPAFSRPEPLKTTPKESDQSQAKRWSPTSKDVPCSLDSLFS